MQASVASPPHPRLRLHRAFSSIYLPDNRDLIVYVPPDYDEQPERSYPVLYMHDGQNLFDSRTSFIEGRTWQMREHADAAIEAGEIEPLIIVGIYNTGDRRLAEYTFERNWQMGGGEADSYGLLLTREIMPFIAARYRIRTDRASTGLGGSSLGGLVTLFLGIRHAQHFGKLAVLSPSVWWNERSILRTASGHTRPHLRIWLDMGTAEGVRHLRDADLLHRRLIQSGWRDGLDITYLRVPGGQHNEDAWAARFDQVLRFLFPAQPA